MKKLFFLCFFLFMSMQIQAQLYIVTVDMRSSSLCGADYCADVTVIGPDNVTEQQIRGFEISQYGGSSDPNFAQHYIELYSILNEIISNGYQLVYVKESFDGENYTNNTSAAYFFAVP